MFIAKASSKQAGSYGSSLLKDSKIVFTPCGLICLCGALERQAAGKRVGMKPYCNSILSGLKGGREYRGLTARGKEAAALG